MTSNSCRTALCNFAILLLLIPAEAKSVFPGAVGFGSETPAGRGGRIIVVTNLDSDGPGSLREALLTDEPRIVVFEVGGIIDLDRHSLRIRSPFLTVAGQTAPSPGITLIRGGISISTHDVLIQHIAVRPGDAGQARRSGWEPDGIGISTGHNVVIDHCSTTWSVDENLSASGPRLEGETSANITFSHCLIAEGLDDSSHHWSAHSKGSLIHDRVTRVSIIGCLYAHNADRNPYFKIGTSGVVVNTIIYNPRDVAINLNWSEKEWAGFTPPSETNLAIVGNVLLPGPDTPAGLPLVSGRIGAVFLQDNLVSTPDTAKGRLVVDSVRTLPDAPLWPLHLVARPADQALEAVLLNAGSRPADRHPIDRRIIASVRTGSGRIIDSQDDVGGYPADASTRHRLNVPASDIEGWLAARACSVEPSGAPDGSGSAPSRSPVSP